MEQNDNLPGKVVCGRPLRKGNGKLCGKPPMRGRTACKLHGGKTPIGVASPHWKDGRYSKIWGKVGLADTYLSYLNNPNKGSLEEQIANTDTRLHSLLDRITDCAGSQHWRAAQAKHQEATTYRQSDPGRAAAAMNALGAVLDAGASDEELWSRIDSTTDLRRRLVDVEGKNLQRLHQVLTVEQMGAILVGITSLLKKYVTNPEHLSEFAEEIRRLNVGQRAKGGNDNGA